MVERFPDLRWDLQHLLIDNEWMCAHLIDHGTDATGRSITLQEFALYRVVEGRIAAVWGHLDKDRLPVV